MTKIEWKGNIDFSVFKLTIQKQVAFAFCVYRQDDKYIANFNENDFGIFNIHEEAKSACEKAFRQQVKELYDKFVRCPTCHGRCWILVRKDWEKVNCPDCKGTGEQPPKTAE